MRIFVTGASGWIGSAVVPELHRAGHDVLGLARSDAAAAIIAGLGAEVLGGDLDDLDALAKGAGSCDGVVHLGYNHDFTRMADAARTDRAAIETMGAALEGRGGPLLIASGVVGLTAGQVATEADEPDDGSHPRSASAEVARSFATRGVRPVIVRFAPTVHGPGDHGFIAALVAIARARGVSGFIDDGANRWPAIHRLDAALLTRLALDEAAAGAAVHATAETGIPARDIAAAIGRGLDLPVRSVAAADAAEHFGWLGRFFAADVPASSEVTQRVLGWTPTQPGLLDDIDAGYYFAT
jgi:nucleoside-diphosphate-sugar epimerase